MDDSIEVVDLKTLKQKFLGARLDEEMVNEEYDAFMDLSTGEFQLTFSKLEDWSGDEYMYELNAVIDSDGKLKKIYAPKCQRLLGDDARGSGYRGHRMDEHDYWRVSSELSELIAEG